ncbi:MAG TPA: class I SAM-dependent rRNA methyltransferase [Planctomycetota bacterium]|nr:class I SAM-dependent rRNA methyltransferase [Planctomycetota bacterium]
MTLPIAHLAARDGIRALAGHPWIWRNEIARIEGRATPGDLVEVRDARGATVGVAYHNARSVIAARLLSRSLRPIDAAFWRERLATALAYRHAVMPGAESLRLVNSEADLLPGLIVDRYGGELVVQLTTAGMDRQRAAIVAALREAFPDAGIRERSDLPVRELEGLPMVAGTLAGEGTGAVTVRIGDARFAIDLADPHKTGSYLDQAANYRRVARHVRPGMRVADVCSHIGGFGIHAALAGAGEVVAVDQAEASIAGVGQAAALNGVAARVRPVRADAFAWLKAEQASGARYDLIILDPPSFTRSREAVPGALRGYKEMHLRALKMLAPGGVLATFCCSHHVSAEAFMGSVVAAAADARVTVRLEERLGAGPDHPVLPTVPETEYLKGFVLGVIAD